jgi:hypothetical protein
MPEGEEGDTPEPQHERRILKPTVQITSLSVHSTALLPGPDDCAPALPLAMRATATATATATVQCSSPAPASDEFADNMRRELEEALEQHDRVEDALRQMGENMMTLTQLHSSKSATMQEEIDRLRLEIENAGGARREGGVGAGEPQTSREDAGAEQELTVAKALVKELEEVVERLQTQLAEVEEKRDKFKGMVQKEIDAKKKVEVEAADKIAALEAKLREAASEDRVCGEGGVLGGDSADAGEKLKEVLDADAHMHRVPVGGGGESERDKVY